MRVIDLADFVLLSVVVDDGLREVVESLESLHDRLLVVVDASTRLSTLQQPRLHRIVLNLHTRPPTNSTSTARRRVR